VPSGWIQEASMSRAIVRGILSAVVLLLPIQLTAQTAPAKRPRPQPTSNPAPAKLTIKEIVQRESPAIVAIYNMDSRGDVRSTGTGFIVMSEGIIITNYHVIEGAHDAQIKLKNGEVFDRVRVVDYDRRRDIAVLQVRSTGLPMVMIGDTTTVEVGDETIAIGNPKGLEHTVSTGIISARRTDVSGLDGTMVFQTTAPISPGSSGGPLYNDRGEVIGITTAQYKEGQNLNFAVDFKYAKLMFGQGPGMNITLAEVTAKEKPAQAREERAQSSPPPQQNNPPPASGGSKAPDPTGNRYRDPTGYASIDLQPGWRSEPTTEKDRIMSLTNGPAIIWVTKRPDITNVQQLFTTYYDSFKKSFVEMTEDSKMVDTSLPGGPAKAQWFILKSNDGSKLKLLLGVMVTSRGGLVFTGIISDTNTADRGPISTMFVSLE
jgi:S1-C subfamily serine protease